MYRRLLIFGCIASCFIAVGAAQAVAQKYGGVLRTMMRSNPPAINVHETSSGDATFAMSPVYNNLVFYDVFQSQETFDTIRPELAESWAWSNENKDLTFKLRRGVRWHDGKPFTSKDVKYTFDVVRGVHEQKLRLNPGKLMYFNVADIVTNGDYEVTFKLKRPQPSLLAILAGGRSPVLPAHRTPTQLRVHGLGTGPFKMIKFERDKQIVLEKNPDYFVKGRPYLDGIVYSVIKGTASQNAALIAHQVDAAFPIHTVKPNYETLRKAGVGLVFTETVSNGTSNIIVNTKKPPFNNLKLRQAVNLALDRNSLIKSVYQGGAVPGGVMIPAPWGLWGLSKAQLAELPGYGDPEKNKAEARRLLAEEGYNEKNPFRIKLSASSVSSYRPPAVWATGELAKVGIIAELDIVDFGVWYQKLARRDFQIAMNATAVAVDDPDAQFYENLKCGSQRNYSDYCSPKMEKRYDEQSMEFDFAKRRRMVQAIDIALAHDVAKPYLGYRIYYYARYPYVKNWIAHNSSYNAWRMQEVWLDK